MTTNAMLVQMLQVSSSQLEQAVSGFDADRWFHAPAEGIGSAAWIVGHATLIDRQVLEELDLPSLPAMPEDWPALYQTRPEDGAGPDDYPGRTILDRFLMHRRVLIAAVSRVAPEALDRQLDPPGRDRYNPLRGDDEANPLFDYGTVLEMIGNMTLYTFQLAGELGLVCQLLGMPVEEDWLL
jgi:hypothetical protein